MKNGDHSDNRIENLSLMVKSNHSSYHSKLYHRDIDKESNEAIEFFNKEGYDQYCVHVGKALYTLIKDRATIEAERSDREAIEASTNSELKED